VLIFFVPGASGLIFGPAIALARLLGVPGQAMAAGWDAFHFWSRRRPIDLTAPLTRRRFPLQITSNKCWEETS
jgi:hypothetical protein